MPSLLKRRSWHLATAWLLAAMQLHLLVVLVLHHHAIPDIALGSSPSAAHVGQNERHSLPLEGQQAYCTACQILRHGAVRPALGNPSSQRLLASPLLAVHAAIVVLSAQPAAWYGRAPPRF